MERHRYLVRTYRFATDADVSEVHALTDALRSKGARDIHYKPGTCFKHNVFFRCIDGELNTMVQSMFSARPEMQHCFIIECVNDSIHHFLANPFKHIQESTHDTKTVQSVEGINQTFFIRRYTQ